MKTIRPVQLITKQQAERLTAKLVAHWKSMETSWWALGRLIDECLKKKVPLALGMNAQAWLERCIPGSASKAFRSLRITRALKGIPQKQVKQITEGNAFALSRLPEKERKSKVWVKKAVDTPNATFQEEVSTVLEKKQGIKREEFISVRLSMPRGIFEQWENAVKKMARVCNIDIVENDARRLIVYERIAMLVNGINEDTLKAALEGGE